MMRQSGWRWMLSATLAVAMLAGCRQSPWITCTVTNREATPVSLVEVDYPGGSFGVQTIPAGGSYKYRFHALGTDTTSIGFTDAAHKSHNVKGPQLQLGQEGAFLVTIEAGGRVTWSSDLHKAR